MCISHFAFEPFFGSKIVPLTFTSVAQFYHTLENIINGQTPVKHHTCVRVSNLFVTFFNGMDMNTVLWSKRHDILGQNKKKNQEQNGT